MTLFILLIAGYCFGIILGKIGERQAQKKRRTLSAAHRCPTVGYSSFFFAAGTGACRRVRCP